MVAAANEVSEIQRSRSAGRVARRLWAARILTALGFILIVFAIVSPLDIARLIMFAVALPFMTAAVIVGEARRYHANATESSEGNSAGRPVGRGLMWGAFVGFICVLGLAAYIDRSSGSPFAELQSEMQLKDLVEGLAFAKAESGEFPGDLADVPDAFERRSTPRPESEARGATSGTHASAATPVEDGNLALSSLFPKRGAPNHFAASCIYFPVKGLSFAPQSAMRLDLWRISAAPHSPFSENIDGHDQIIVAFTRDTTIGPKQSILEGRRRHVVLANCKLVPVNDAELADMIKQDAAMRKQLGWPVYVWDGDDGTARLLVESTPGTGMIGDTPRLPESD